MSYNVGSANQDAIVGKAIGVAQEGCKEIDAILQDIRETGDKSNTALDLDVNKADVQTESSRLGDQTAIDIKDASGNTTDINGKGVLERYGIGLDAPGISITQAAGAMVVDDLMQKISTKVQVAAQLLSTSNNINKTVSRIMSQG
jgi:hypothetical protein